MSRRRVTAHAIFLMREVEAQRDRIFASDARPPGVAALMELGYLVRVGEQRAMVTPTGRAFLRGLDYASKSRFDHALPDGFQKK